MDKGQAIHNFWASFGLPAYDENSIPTGEEAPTETKYITYSVLTDSLDSPVALNASLWYRSTSWAEISQKAEEISEYLVKMQPPTIPLNEGRLYLTKGTPFAQRMSDDDDMVRRIYLTLQAEFLTAY